MDVDLYRAVNSLAGHSHLLDQMMRWGASYLPMLMAVVIGLTWFWPGKASDRSQRQHLAIYAVSAALIGLALAQVIGHVWFRDRPYVHHSATLLVAPSGDPSFPSDHAVGAFGLTVPYLLARRRIGGVLLGLATTLALTRVAVGTHYPSDVIGGALLGSAAAYLVWRMRDWLEVFLVPFLSLARRLRFVG